MSLSDPKAVIFDLDDTLIPTSIAIEKYLDVLASGIGKRVNMSKEDILESFRQTSEKVGFLPQGTYLHKNDLMVHICGKVDPREVFAEEVKAAEAAKTKALKPHPTVMQMLNSLQSRGQRLYIYTESTPLEAVRKLCASGLSRYFQGVFTAPLAEVEKDQKLVKPIERTLMTRVHQVAKPKPKQYESCWREVLGKVPCAARDVIMVGDHFKRDVEMAKKVGMVGLHATWIIAPYKAEKFPSMAALTGGTENLKGFMSKYQGIAPRSAQLTVPASLLRFLTNLKLARNAHKQEQRHQQKRRFGRKLTP